MSRTLRSVSAVVGIAVVLMGFALPAGGIMPAPTWTAGDYWVYSLSSGGLPAPGTMRLDVLGIETVVAGGIPYPSYRVSVDERIVFPPPMSLWMNATGVQWYRASDYAQVAQYVNMTIEQPPNPPMMMNGTAAFDPPERIQWPLTPGDSWIASGWINTSMMFNGVPPAMWQNRTATVSFRVEAERPVGVPAGTFPTTPLNGTSDGYSNVTYWSPTAGNGVLLQTFNPTGAEMSRLELVDFRYQGGGPTNLPPTVALASPVGGEDWTGGSTHPIAYVTADPDDMALLVTIEASLDGGATWGPVATFPGQRPGPQMYAWTVPLADTTQARIRVCASDGVNLPACAASGDFTIDSTPPALVAIDPTGGASGVPVSKPITITFSEAMDRPSTQAAVSIVPMVVGITYAWPDPATLVIGHNDFAPCTTYTVTVAAGARDASDPGNFLSPAGPVPNPSSFTTACGLYIVRTDPYDGETDVELTRPIVVEFSGPVNVATMTITVTPLPGLLTPTWSAGNTVLTITHGDFAPCTTYTVGITADGLVPGPVPNPWWFTTACAPTVTISAPAGGEVWTGGSTHDIVFTTSDADTNLTILVEVYDGAGWSPAWGPQGWPMGTLPIPITIPDVDTTAAQVRVTATDSTGLSGSATSPAFTIDGTAPTVTSSIPGEGAAGVSRTAPFTIVFSERMDATSTEGAISLSPGTWTLTFSWSGDGRTATVGHAALAAGTQYTLRVGATALDASDPGNALASAYTANFTTASATTVTADAGGPYTGYVGDTLTLDGSASTGPIVNWTWGITVPGGGSTSLRYEQTVAYTFTGAGTYTVSLTVRDASGGTDTQGTTATIQLRPDTTPPTITHTPPGAVYVGDTIRITATVTDAGSGVDQVYLVYTPVGGAEQNVTMTLSGGVYGYTIPAQSAAGTVRYHIYAVDSDGNGAITQAYAVAVQERAPAPSSDLWWIALAIVLVAVALLVVAILLRRRKRKAEPSAAPPTEPPAS